ncbi:hypothetical protein [uncultured Parasutterella sp.]|uniref:hypothetical protein n=5 Tax=Sutterellaceae TaxID=995019 RepID=UPI0025A60862|nr:hypothetical protein [uncultured Parasutterella sp.]
MKINDLINPFEFTGYLITSDEYVRDYMVLPDEFSSCLFKLRLGYAMKGSPLTQEEVFALYPVLTENRRHILDTVTARFFKKDKELLIDERLEKSLSMRKEARSLLENFIQNEVSKRLEKMKAGWMSSEKRKLTKILQEKIEAELRTESARLKDEVTNTEPQFINKPVSISSTNVQQNDDRPSTDGQQNFNRASTKVQQTTQQTFNRQVNKTSANDQQNANRMSANDPTDVNRTSTNRSTKLQQTVNKQVSKTSANHPTNSQQIHECCSEALSTNGSAVAQKDGKTAVFSAGNVTKNEMEIAENEKSSSRTYTRAHRSDRISDINLINKNINKSESVSESDRRLKIKNLFAREKSAWMIGEVLDVLVFFGLDEKALARWRSRNPENQNFILELAAGGMSRFDYDTIAQVFARCQAAKDKEGKPLSSAVAFVLKSLQHELTAVSNRKNARQTDSESTQPKRFRDIDYMEGIERLNPDGTFVLKRKTEGR